MPKVSVIMPTYNQAGFLSAAIDSVLGQGFLDFEFLIFDDASSDGTAEILKNYQRRDSRVQIFTNRQNLGLTANLNAGLAKSQGEFIARIDSDDRWSDKNKLKKQTEFLDAHPDCALVGTWAEILGENGKKHYNFTPPETDANIRKQILRHNCFAHSSILARKEVMLKAGGYPTGQKYIEDYALWLAMGRISQLANLPEIMLSYRVNPKGITQTKNRFQIKAALNLIQDYKNFYPNYFLAKVKWSLQLLFT